MCAAMFHRGPDDDGLASDGPATIGMRRLAIFDPANGHQPMFTPDRRFTLVFNGAIYNFRELRADLAALGHVFHTQCDTEVLLMAYAEWGADCLARLRGMFAFAVWDRTRQTLFLARDPFGIKPLYYRHDGATLLFGSELNALISSGRFSPEIDPVSVTDYLAWQAVPAPRTIYRNVFSLRPGESATFHAGKLDLTTSWRFRTIPNIHRPCRTYDEFSRELRTRLDDTIRAHMLADVPVGAFLSGGLDSAVVAGLMTRMTGSRLRTFSIGFEEAAFSEIAEAEATARHIGTEHHNIILTGSRVAADVERILATFDQPTGDGINTYYVSQAAREGGVTAALSGLGGDELFGGYPNFRNIPRLAQWLPWWRRIPHSLRSPVLRRLDGGDVRQRKLADFLRHASDIHELASMQRRVFASDTARAILSPETLLVAESRPVFHPEFANLADDLVDAAPQEIISAWELRTYMSDLLLRDSDVMSMRHSLELRVPYVDRYFIEWLWHQPAEFKYDAQYSKRSLREAASDVLPPALMQRQKRGFTLPFPLWMRGELRPFLDEVFSDKNVDRSGLFARTGVQSLWRGYLERDDQREWSRVWSLAMLLAFAGRRTTAVATAPAPIEVRSRHSTSPTEKLPVSAPVRRPARRRTTMLVTPEIFATAGGINRILQLYLKALCEFAEANNDGVKLLALNDPTMEAHDLRRYANENLDEWRVCSRNKGRFVREALRMSRDVDIIVCGHIGQLPVAWAASLINRRLRYALIAHGIEVWRPFSRIERLALKGATRIFCVSDFTRRELLKFCPLPEGRAVVLHNALDPFFKIGPGVPYRDCAPVILTVSRLTYDDRYKGIADLITAMPEVRRAIPNAQLRIIGRGDDLPRLQGIARNLGLLGTGVEFLGYVSDKLMAEEIHHCRLFAMPSRKEGFGLVYLEAMAHGRPCLGARAGGVPEVITDESGLLVEYGDIRGIAEGCIAGLQRTWDQTAVLERARAFSYPHFKDKLRKLLETVN